MPADVILDISVTDSVRYEEYKRLAPPVIAAFGGKHLARGGKVEVRQVDGRRAALSCSSSRPWSRQRHGSNHRSTARPVR